MKILFSLVTLCMLQLSLINAQTRKDIFENSNYKYTFYGIDYSNAKFIGEFSHFEENGKKDMDGIKSEFFYRWNDVLVKEKGKFNIRNAFHLNKLEYRGDEIATINDRTIVDSMAAYKSKIFNKPMIQEIVSTYNFNEKEGVGIVFIAEYLNKFKAKFGFHFVVFNIATKEILLSSRFEEKAKGFGLRNYWINPIYKALGRFDFRYRRWKEGSLD